MTKQKSILFLMLAFTLLLLFLPSTSVGLTITPTFGAGFGAKDIDIIDESIGEWGSLFCCGNTLTINFNIDNGLNERPIDPALAETGDWTPDSSGRPTSPTITVDYDDLDWTLGDPTPNQSDALYVLKHEIAHALGFTVLLDNFAAYTLTVAGNRFYDLNHDGVFDAGDFDLIVDPFAGTHAPDGSGDLMERYIALGDRRYPTLHHAQVLADAFGYCIPEPSTIVLTGVGVSLLVILGRRRRDVKL